MDAKGKLFATTLPSERIYNKWFVSVPAELLWVPGIANYKQEVGWSIDPEHTVLESVFISKTKERERENYKCHWRIKTQWAVYVSHLGITLEKSEIACELR